MHTMNPPPRRRNGTHLPNGEVNDRRRRLVRLVLLYAVPAPVHQLELEPGRNEQSVCGMGVTSILRKKVTNHVYLHRVSRLTACLFPLSVRLHNFLPCEHLFFSVSRSKPPPSTLFSNPLQQLCAPVSYVGMLSPILSRRTLTFSPSPLCSLPLLPCFAAVCSPPSSRHR